MAVGIVLVLTAIVQISIIGKNLTFSTRFTPPSTEKSLKDSTYYTEAQILMLGLSSLIIVIVPFLTYCIFIKSKRFFLPLWIGYMIMASLLLVVNVYYLTGSQNYKDYLSSVSSTIDNSPNYCF